MDFADPIADYNMLADVAMRCDRADSRIDAAATAKR
jgi:hypothetical protein